MGYPIQQNQTSQPLIFLMIDSTDHINGKIELSPTVTISKNGAGFASPSGAVTEIGNGWYKVAPNATDANTLGPIILHATATGADPTDDRFDVVAYNPWDAVRLGLTAIPNANAAANGGLATVDANNAVKIQSGTGSNQIALSSGAVTVGTNNDKTGYALSASGVDAILDEAITEPVGPFAWGSATLRNIIGWLGALSRNKITQNSTTQTLSNDAENGSIGSASVNDDGTTFTRGEWS